MPDLSSDNLLMDKNPTPSDNQPVILRHLKLWFKIAGLTMREPIMRFANHFALLAMIAAGVVAARLGLATMPAAAAVELETESLASQEIGDDEDVVGINVLPPYSPPQQDIGIRRLVMLHTVFPERPRIEYVEYEVQSGDTLFGIAEQYNLEPESVLWANYDVLNDDPHRLSPGQTLLIPPVDGTTYVWSEGDGLSGVASFFGVDPGEILEWPGNDLDPFVDPADPGIEVGTVLMIPGGHRETRQWSFAPIAGLRGNPSAARIYGPGACSGPIDGPLGTYTFIYPTVTTYLSGYDYSATHPALDFAGSTGNAVFASDTGVVVYAGWNDWGYGYVIVLDHGNGWQTLYAHLSSINVSCGQPVTQGQVIGAVGSTGNSSGPHLHFEMMHPDYGKVNPWGYLQ
ncbi:MAG: peptidoglycan DD-metalloendopeptidase family protein [Anaerolineales bacterium]|jgi:murein DD-endopeptidase MepM/ murein hydrolase activator NlpD